MQGTRAHRSWLESANDPGTDFPLANLPVGVFRRVSGHGPASIGVAIGECILDLLGCAQEGVFAHLPAAIAQACEAESLNALMALGPGHWSALRRELVLLLNAESPAWREHQRTVEPLLVKLDEVTMLPPAVIGDYTDFYASIDHATRVGTLFRPNNPLLPNYKYVPIGYHGRTSSIIVSGTTIYRPGGQSKPAGSDRPAFGPTKSLDYEMEVGMFVGTGNAQGNPITLQNAESHIFGLCLVNDWSARDIQAWEAQPLGPFLAKNFATTISPWVVTMEALAPFRVPAFKRPEVDPEPLPYLSSGENRESGGIDLHLEVLLSSARMRHESIPPLRMGRGNLRDLYWTFAQMLTHHASNGCNLRPGDLLASGTVSGPAEDARGCMLELTRNGAEPTHLPTGETRDFLAEGDEVILRGWCEREGYTRIGFGECRGTIASVSGCAAATS